MGTLSLLHLLRMQRLSRVLPRAHLDPFLSATDWCSWPRVQMEPGQPLPGQCFIPFSLLAGFPGAACGLGPMGLAAACLGAGMRGESCRWHRDRSKGKGEPGHRETKT